MRAEVLATHYGQSKRVKRSCNGVPSAGRGLHVDRGAGGPADLASERDGLEPRDVAGVLPPATGELGGGDVPLPLGNEFELDAEQVAAVAGGLLHGAEPADGAAERAKVEVGLITRSRRRGTLPGDA